jgi:hypothetical protein
MFPIRELTGRADMKVMLDGHVEIDETFVGGKSGARRAPHKQPRIVLASFQSVGCFNARSHFAEALRQISAGIYFSLEHRARGNAMFDLHVACL